MDMMFHRYANPMIIMDKMILTGRFSNFVNEFIKIRNEEMEDQTKWEYWLHKVFDISFADFLEKTKEKAAEVMTNEEAKKTVKESWGILQGFDPNTEAV